MTPGTGSARSYGFDASSNLTTLPAGGTGSYDKNGELTSALGGTTTNYTYNADGQRVTAKQGSTTTASGTWNGAAELTAYSNASAGMTAATYDGDGLRGTAAYAAGTQQFVWNNVSTLPQITMDSSNAYIYTFGTAPVEQVSLATGAVTYLVTDALGSVRGVVNSSGSLTATTSYDVWGNPQTSGGLTTTTPFGFAGGYTDADGLVYLIARYYDPATGQFISVDPLVDTTVEPYAYADENPVSLTDPTGTAIYQHCVQATRFLRACAASYDHFSSVYYIKHLDYLSEVYQNWADFYERIEKTWARVLYLYYQLRALEAAQEAFRAELILDACGGEENPRSGLYLVTAEGRLGWWWGTWHYTGWHQIRATTWWCHE